MKVELRHRHFGVHKPVEDTKIPGEFSDYATPKGDEPDAYMIDEGKLLAALPEGFLRAAPGKVLLAVSDELGGTGQTGLKTFRDWAKYFDAYVLDLVKAESALQENQAEREADPMRLGTEVCREIMRELDDQLILMELPDRENPPAQVVEVTTAGDQPGVTRLCVLVPTLDWVAVRTQTGYGTFGELAVLSPGDSQFNKYIFVRYPEDKTGITEAEYKTRLREAVDKALAAATTGEDQP